MLKITNEFYLISLDGIASELSHIDVNGQERIIGENVLRALSVYSLTKYSQNTRIMRVYYQCGDIVREKAVLYFTRYNEAEKVLKHIISVLLKDAESLPSIETLSPREKLLSALFTTGHLFKV